MIKHYVWASFHSLDNITNIGSNLKIVNTPKPSLVTNKQNSDIDRKALKCIGSNS